MAAVAAVLIAAIAVILIVFSGGSSYSVRAMFENASQIVSGDLVEVGGNSIGTVGNITISPHGQAVLTLNISNGAYDPLHQGTKATIREVSLSGVANRYVALDVGPTTAPSIRSGGVIPEHDTTSEVDLDEIFDTLDARTRKGLQDVIQGTASQYAGAGQKAQTAFQYLNPAVAASSLLFAELNRDTAKFTNFIVKSGHLFGDISQRQADLSALVRHLATTTQALANQHVALGSSIAELPPFMRLANTTFVNLRSALNDLTPLVNASKPVAPKLQRLLEVLRPLAEDSVPTVRDLANIISRPGPDNDLIELTKLGVPLAQATVRNVRVDGKLRPGAFPESTKSLNESSPELAFARPYAVDLTGWFEGFSHPGGYDANGAFSRVAPVISIATLNNGGLDFCSSAVLKILPDCSTVTNLLSDASARLALTKSLITSDQGDRCPGSMERGAIYYPYKGYACDPTEVPTGS